MVPVPLQMGKTRQSAQDDSVLNVGCKCGDAGALIAVNYSASITIARCFALSNVRAFRSETNGVLRELKEACFG